MTYNVEDVFVTEGVPEFTFVKPPNYGDILVDIRRAGKPVVVEGQSGTGKTTTVKRILKDVFPGNTPRILTPRNRDHNPIIESISEESGSCTFVIDDFHRVDQSTKERIADLAKVIAERDDRDSLPKIIIVGINNVGSDLIQTIPDIAKRIGIHRIRPGTAQEIDKIINKGCERLNIEIFESSRIFNYCRGDYWLTQQMCKNICSISEVYETSDKMMSLNWDVDGVISRVINVLWHNYDTPVREFCRGRRFRPTNDPYFKLLRTISLQDRSSVDLNELANANPEVKGSINNVKDRRLSVLLDAKPECSRLFYYDSQTKNFALEDPALFFYLRHLDWEELRGRCGFRDNEKDYEFDVAISFAGENRSLAEFICAQLKNIDISVFYDRKFENNFLGSPWADQFRDVFVNKSRLVVVLLDKYHSKKVWPTFERDCFRPRVAEEAVIPVRLDDTDFVGIPADINGIRFEYNSDDVFDESRVIDEIVFRIADKLESM